MKLIRWGILSPSVDPQKKTLPGLWLSGVDLLLAQKEGVKEDHLA